MAENPLEYQYIAYVDEAGEPGLNKVRPIDEDGASEWLILSAVVIRAKWENDLPEWLTDIRADIGLDKRGPIHFRNLSPSRRLAVAKKVAGLPVRGFAICSNKKNMRRHRNPRAEKIPSQEWFYNWCIRLLLERVTAFCETRRAKDYDGKPCKIKIEFSRRGGHRYSQTNAYTLYLRHQEQAGSLYLTKRQIITDLLNTDLMEHHPHWSRPGLQLADTVASAYYSAANTIGPGAWDTEPAKALSLIMAKENGSAVNFGVALQPDPAWKAELNEQQQEIFRHAGYDFARW
jgi:Protein of unknown function (DUF3800)